MQSDIHANKPVGALYDLRSTLFNLVNHSRINFGLTVNTEEEDIDMGPRPPVTVPRPRASPAVSTYSNTYDEMQAIEAGTLVPQPRNHEGIVTMNFLQINYFTIINKK